MRIVLHYMRLDPTMHTFWGGALALFGKIMLSSAPSSGVRPKVRTIAEEMVVLVGERAPLKAGKCENPWQDALETDLSLPTV